MKKRKRILIVLGLLVCVTTVLCLCACTGDVNPDECSHNWSNWKTKTTATCTADGLKTRECSLCGEIEEKVVSATGHTESDWIVDEDATCTNLGSQHKECLDCGEKLGTVEIKALGHSGGEATCTQKAVCSVCGEEYGKLDSNNHDFGDWIKEEPATCVVAGVKAHKTCKLCGKHFDLNGNEIKDLTIKALGHDITIETVTAPTCTESGVGREVCSRCDYVNPIILPANGHSASKWIVDGDSSCFIGGTKHKECTDCGEILATTEIPVGSHIESDWITDTEATCTEAGSKYIECTICHTILETEGITVLGHDIVPHSAKSPTCTEVGWYAYDTCSRCDYSTYVEIDALAHASSDWITDSNADCTTDGTKHKECTICGTVTETGTITVLGHIGGKATCTQKAICSVCGKEYGKPLGHDIVPHSAKSPTCTEAGWKAYETCSRCDYSTYVEIKALGHTSSDWLTDTEVTCTKSGSKHKECLDCCEILDTEAITALGHNYVEGVCSMCGKEYKATAGLTYSYQSSSQSYTVIGYIGTDTEIYIPDIYDDGTNGIHAVTCIGSCAFQDCVNLTSVTIPYSVTSIENNAFSGCTGITEINYNATNCENLSLSNYVFAYSGQADAGIKVTIGANVKRIPAYLFYPDSSNAPKITEVVFEEGSVCESIGDNAFENCDDLTSITIPDSVTSIGSAAFYYCTGLTNVIIPDRVTSIGGGAFSNTAWYNNQPDGLVYVGKAAYAYKGKRTMPENTAIELEAGTKCIVDDAFSDCTGLVSIIVPDSVISVGNYAFAGCTGLTSITIGNGVIRIGEEAFCECTSLTSVTIGDSVEDIGRSAFNGCASLMSVIIPNSVMSIGEYAFSYSRSLTSINYKGSEVCWEAIVKGNCWDNCTGDYTIYYNYVKECEKHAASDWITDTEATCTEVGAKHKECTICGTILEVEEIFALGHASSDWITDTVADCTTDGTQHKECTVCGTILKTGTINAFGHTSSAWIIDIKATCTTAGTKHKECTVCNTKLSTGTITVLGHNYVNGVCTGCGKKDAYTRDSEDDSIIYFGSYPQSEVTDSSLKSTLTSLAGTLPTSSNSGGWTSYGYYNHSNVTNYMWYIDIEKGGEKYRGVYFIDYRSKTTSYICTETYSYQDDNGYDTGTVYWFKYEPIKWQILTESSGKAFLLAKMALDSQEYNPSLKNTYSISTIRTWLNETFYNTAFSDLQKEVIQTTKVDNSTSSGASYTNDKIFLLSSNEATTYLTNDTARIRKSTDYAECQGVYCIVNPYQGNAYWWLRTPSGSTNACQVRFDGSVKYSEYTYATNLGVVPALWIVL